MKDNLDKVAEASAKLEAKTDAILAKFVNFPFSWIPALAIVALAIVGVISLVK